MRNVIVVVVVAIAAATHALVWLMLHEQVSPPNANGVLPSISFSPIDPKHDGESDTTSEAQIRSDLAAIAPYTQSVRTYSVSNGLDRVAPLAAEVGLRVTLGVWINEWQEQNEREIEKAIANYGKKAKDGTLTMDDMKGGTFTISNGGVFGGLMSTPIINPPQSAVLGLHRIEDRPVVRDGQLAVGRVAPLFVRGDHRLTDAYLLARFVGALREYLMNPALMESPAADPTGTAPEQRAKAA